MSTISDHGADAASTWKVHFSPGLGRPEADTICLLLCEHGRLTVKSYDDDPLLPTLRIASSPTAMRGYFSALLGEGVLTGTPVPIPVRHWAGSRCTLRYEVPTQGGTAVFYAKVYRSRGRRVADLSAGLYDRSQEVPHMPAIPRMLAFWPDLAMVVQEGLEGAEVSQLLYSAAGAGAFVERWAYAVGQHLAALHRCPLLLAPTITMGKQVRRLQNACQQAAPVLNQTSRGEGDRLLHLLRDLERYEREAEQPVALCHGEFRLASFLLLPASLALLDLDTVCLAPREMDVGRLLADLVVLGVRHLGEASVMAQGRVDFLRGYAEGEMALYPRALLAYQALWLLKDTVRTVRSQRVHDWPHRAGELLDHVQALLAQAGEGAE
jgi:hypothetical protein